MAVTGTATATATEVVVVDVDVAMALRVARRAMPTLATLPLITGMTSFGIYDTLNGGVVIGAFIVMPGSIYASSRWQSDPRFA